MFTSPTVRTPALPPRPTPPPPRPTPAIHGSSVKITLRKPADGNSFSWRCNAVSKPRLQEYSIDLIHNGLPVIQWPEKTLEESSLYEVSEVKDTEQMIDSVKRMLGSMSDGEISISAYDTAWVAQVPNIYGSGGPQFPSSLKWIVNNQLADGSWGDNKIFSAHDRLINTLACIITLKSWRINADKCEKGLSFLRENIWRLAEEDAEHMPIGFEIAFPSLMDTAKALGLEVPHDDPALQHVYARRDIKLQRIPRDVMHNVPTTLLHSLEGMSGLDWKKLLRFQSSDGSFLFSPASTASALMQTRDEKCLQYLQRAVNKFDGGVPNVYPVDLFEHLWAVDRLQRLGISRHFESEIKVCMNYIYRYWNKDGICWARNSSVHDVDDTAMGFRLLRLHGYDVSPDVFRHFEKDGEFFCFAGQSNQAITGMYNLNRTSHVSFPGEEILKRAKCFSYNFLREKQAANQLLDKWIITKDLPGEVGYALDFPYFASLPRVEARLYVEQYGGEDDVWIGKTLYRMLYVNNELYLELAKRDYNHCQAVHQLEWLGIHKWYEEWGLEELGLSRESVLRCYFLAAASIFEPERAAERLGWACTAVLAEAVALHHGGDIVRAITESRHGTTSTSAPTRTRGVPTAEALADAVLRLIRSLASDVPPGTRHHLRHAWEEWLLTSRGGADKEEGETGLLLVRTVEVCAGRAEPTADPLYQTFARLTSSVCHRLSATTSPFTQGNREDNGANSSEKTVEPEMQELLQCVLQSSTLEERTKQTFLAVTKSFYYAAHCPSDTIRSHIAKVLFERVV